MSGGRPKKPFYQRWGYGQPEFVENAFVLPLKMPDGPGRSSRPRYIFSDERVGLPDGRWLTVSFSGISEITDVERSVEMTYELSGCTYHETILFVATPQRLGGSRWWPLCPYQRTVDQPQCGRRSGKLYLPLNHDRFACCICRGLGYLTSHNSHQFDRLYRDAARDLGLDKQTARQLLEYRYLRGPKRSAAPILPPDWKSPYPGFESWERLAAEEPPISPESESPESAGPGTGCRDT